MPPSRCAKVPVPSILSPPRSSRANRDPGEPVSAPSSLRCLLQRGPAAPGAATVAAFPPHARHRCPFCLSPAALIHRGAPGQAERGRLPPASLRDASFPSPQPPQIRRGRRARLQPLTGLQPCIIPPFSRPSPRRREACPAAASSNAGGKSPFPNPGPASLPAPREGWRWKSRRSPCSAALGGLGGRSGSSPGYFSG